jgi:hypothetical protein
MVNSATDYNVRFKVFLTVTAEYCHLECDAIQPGRSLLAFQRILLLPSSDQNSMQSMGKKL